MMVVDMAENAKVKTNRASSGDPEIGLGLYSYSVRLLIVRVRVSKRVVS